MPALHAAVQGLLDGDDPEGALACCRARLAQFPDDATAHRHAGRILAQQRDFTAARRSVERACELAPRDARGWIDLGLVEAAAQRLEPASRHFARALSLDPACSDAWHNLGTALKALGRREEAFSALREALRLSPERADTYLNLGNLLIHAGQFDDAVECFERAAKHDQALARARGRLGQALSLRGQVRRAEGMFRQALALDAQQPGAWLGLGRTLEDLGRADDALDCYEQALARRPDDARALGAWFALTPHEADHDRLRCARIRLDVVGAAEPRALLGYGLAKYHDRRGAFADAADAATRANRLRRERAGALDRAALRARVDRIIETYTAGFFAQRRDMGIGTDQPVFIVGMPRSGTTLMEQILSAHPMLHGAGEIPDLAQAADALGAAQEHEPWQAAADLDRPRSLECAYAYLRALRQGAPRGVLRISDKSPLNFFHLAFAALLFPGARVIHCLREPRDNALSIWLENFNVAQRYATDFEDLAFFHAQHRRLMAHWRAVLPLPMLDMRYEDTVADVEAQARRLCDFLGVPWDVRCLSFHRNARSVQTPSRWQVRQPIFTGSVGRWLKYEAHLPALVAAFADAP